MAKDLLHWGKPPQLIFESANEYYRALGHLTNSKAYSVSYEYNKKNGSYSDACRIHKLSSASNIPQAFKNKLKTNRINCNKYVNNLMENHGFVQSGNVFICSFNDVLATVPNEYITDFIKGFEEACVQEKTKSICYITEAIKVEGKHLRVMPQPTKTTTRTVKNPKTNKPKSGKRDYIAQYIHDFEVGEAGEALVYKHEYEIIEQAKKKGQIDKSIFVKWVSREDDSKGYDILSYDIDKKEPKYIEVKTTTCSKNTPFYISENELQFSETHKEQYCIYRVYGLKNDSSEQVNFFIINGYIKDQENFVVSKENYNIVSVRRETNL